MTEKRVSEAEPERHHPTPKTHEEKHLSCLRDECVSFRLLLSCRLLRFSPWLVSPRGQRSRLCLSAGATFQSKPRVAGETKQVFAPIAYENCNGVNRPQHQRATTKEQLALLLTSSSVLATTHNISKKPETEVRSALT